MSISTANKTIRWVCVIAWMILIFVFSAQPHSGEATRQYLGDYNVPVRKAAHMTEYAVLFLLSRWAVFGSTTHLLRRNLFPILIAVIYACTDEFHQNFVPGRSAQVSDVLVDAAGASIAWLVVLASKRFSK